MNAEPVTGLLPSPMLALTVGWFDPVFLLIMALGFWRGRIKGASHEHFALGQWLLFAVVGGLMSRALGKLMAKWLGLSLYATGIFGYAVGGGLVLIAAAILRTFNANQMLDAQFFGKTEEPAGGALGTLKSLCILMIPLALLHAHKVPDLANPKGIRDQLHAQIFERSLAGAAIEKAGGFMLIPAATEARRATVGQKKNQQMNNAGK